MKNLSYTNEHDLLCAIAMGNHEAFSLLFEQLKNKVFSFAVHLTHSEIIAEEITQEVFINIWVNRQTITQVNNIEAWAVTVTRNLCFNHLKKKALELKVKAAATVEKDATENPVDNYIFYKEQLNNLQLAMEQLSPQQRTIFRLNREDGMKNEEIARHLNIAPNTVKTHMVSALRKIRQFMQSNPVNIFFTMPVFWVLFFFI